MSQYLENTISECMQTSMSADLIGLGYCHTLLSGCLDETLSSVISGFREDPSYKTISAFLANISSYWKSKLNTNTIGSMIGA